MLQSTNWRSVALALSVSATIWLTGCKTIDEVQPTTTTSTTTTAGSSATNADVNTWILSNMQTYYYWNTKIPANPDKALAPADFFNSLLYKYDKIYKKFMGEKL